MKQWRRRESEIPAYLVAKLTIMNRQRRTVASPPGGEMLANQAAQKLINAYSALPV